MSKFVGALSFLVLLMYYGTSAQDASEPLSVGIFIYEGVEILDFAGPAEVFAATTGFSPFLVAVTEEPVVSQGFIVVTPQYSIHNCPDADIWVFPGGNSGALQSNDKLINWIAEQAQTSEIMMSVCTGAALMSKAGLLEDKEVTTWYGFIPRLQQMTPGAVVLEQTRFVDNGQVVTTAGVSAGIDGALHVVSRIMGEDVAMATARYMEYDKWHPGDGKIIESPFVTSVRAVGLTATLKTFQPNHQDIKPLYYFGEMRNLAFELLDSNPGESAIIFKWLLETTKPTATLYDGLGASWQKMGKESPVSSTIFVQHIETGETDWARETWELTMQMYPGWLLCEEAKINSAGYRFLQAGNGVKARDVFKLNSEIFPGSANAWDSLADGYEATGEHAQAIAASETCLRILIESNRSIPNAEALENASGERIERLKGKK